VHGQIEADLDAMMLYRIRGKTIRDFCPAREMLRVSDTVLLPLDGLYCHIAEKVFGLNIALGAFSRCVGDMRLTLHAFYSPRGAKRQLLGGLERRFRRHSLIQALSTRPEASATCDFDNHEGLPWKNPFTGEINETSFVRLFAAAQEQAAARLQLLAAGAPTNKLFGGLDFEGTPI
jgi:hypothetical protein